MNNASITVRPFRYDDLTDVIKMDAKSGNYVQRWVEALKEDAYNDYSWGIYSGNILIGYCTIGYADDVCHTIAIHPLHNHESYLLSDVYITPEYRGCGFGLKLITEAIKGRFVREEPRPVFLELMYDRLKYFYQKAGFELLPDEHNACMVYIPNNKNNFKEKETMENKKVSTKKIIIGAIIAVLVIVLVFASVKIVPTGYTGVRRTFGQISQQTVEEGINFKIPFVQTISLVNNKQQDAVFENQIWGESQEKTPVYAANTIVTYHISADKSVWLRTNVSSIKDLINEPIVSSALKAAMLKLTVADVTDRTVLEPMVKDYINASLAEKYGENTVVVEKVTITNMDFEDTYNEAIAAKSIAQQQYEQQAIENAKAVEKAEADKQVALKNAEAEAEAAKIKANGQAEANNTLSNSLNENILRSKYYDKWNGELPQVVSDSSVIYGLGGNTENAQ